MFQVRWFSFHLELEAIATDSGWLYCECYYLAIYWKFFWTSSGLYSLQFQVVSGFILSSLKLREFPVMTCINFQKAVRCELDLYEWYKSWFKSTWAFFKMYFVAKNSSFLYHAIQLLKLTIFLKVDFMKPQPLCWWFLLCLSLLKISLQKIQDLSYIFFVRNGRNWYLLRQADLRWIIHFL